MCKSAAVRESEKGLADRLTPCCRVDPINETSTTGCVELTLAVVDAELLTVIDTYVSKAYRSVATG